MGLVPIPAFICCHCLLAEYDNGETLLPLSKAASYDRLATLLGLVRGRMLLLSQHKRRTTHTSYASGRADLMSFAKLLSLNPLPLTPALIMDWGVHDLVGKNLDSSTVKLRFNAAYDIYDYARTRLGLRALANPLRDPEVVMFTRITDANYKKRSRARCSVPIHVVAKMLQYGWDVTRQVGLWGRLRWTFLNLGMLRVGGANALIVDYEIMTDASGALCVVFNPESDVKTLLDDISGEMFVDCSIDKDKNVGSWNRRHAYIPGYVPGLDASPVLWLHEYLIHVRPPAGGPLFVKPTKKGFAAKAGNASNDIKVAYKRSCTLSTVPMDTEMHAALGTHSGRKSLAQWLWDDGHCRRIIADAGGWFLKRDAVDMYFKTARHIILAAVRNVGKITRA